MLRKSLAILSGVVVASSLGTAFSAPSYAAEGELFSCDTEQLATVAGEQKAVIISWKSEDFSQSGYTPLRRCNDVSKRFNDFHASGQLEFLTAGIVNNSPVICATKNGGACDRTNVLFTLNRKNRQNAAAILQTLFDNRGGADGVFVQESGERPYINVKKALAELGVDARLPRTRRSNVSRPETNQRPQTSPRRSW